MLQVDTPLPVGDYTNLRQYRERGWCEMECAPPPLTAAAPFCSSRSHRRPCARALFPRRYRASGMVKHTLALISLRKLTGRERSLSDVIGIIFINTFQTMHQLRIHRNPFFCPKFVPQTCGVDVNKQRFN